MTTTEQMRRKMQRNAKQNGMYLTPDMEHIDNLLQGLVENDERYGYPSCPCRISSGDFETDRDIICPCDYRTPDVEEFGCCYCSLFVDNDIQLGKKEAESIPERRPYDKQMKGLGLREDEVETVTQEPGSVSETSRKLLYCKQCGYTVFLDDPPYICPLCQAKREMFEELILQPSYKTRKIV